APRRVRRVPALRPVPLEPQAAGAREELPTVANDVLRVAEAARRFRAEQVGEPRLPLLERQRGDVLAVDVEEVGPEVGELSVARAGRVLQGLKARAAVRQQHRHLAVEERAPDGELAGCRRHLREVVRPVLAVPADERDRPPVDAAADAVAVELELVQPVVAFGRRVDERRELRREYPGERDVARAGAGARHIAQHSAGGRSAGAGLALPPDPWIYNDA